MKNHLSIGEAAKELGLAVDTVRRLANNGKLRANLTPGGHRRFTRRALDAYRTGEQAPVPRALPAHIPRKGVTSLPRRGPQPPSDEDNFDPDFDDIPDDSRDVPDEPAARPVRPPLPNYAPPTRWRPPMQEEAMPTAKNTPDEIKRLERLKTHGLSAIPYNAPPTWRGKVVADLERFVTAERIPEWVSVWEAQRIVAGRVEEVLEPWHEEVAEREQKESAERQLQALIADGNLYARMETVSDWDDDAAEEARRKVELILKNKVEGDWTQGEVRALVDDILAEWDDDEDEGEEVDDEDEYDD